jgi:hypothetical protein
VTGGSEGKTGCDKDRAQHVRNIPFHLVISIQLSDALPRAPCIEVKASLA